MPQENPKRQFITIVVIIFLGFLGISIPYLIFPALFLNPEYSILPQTASDSTKAIFLGITLAAYPLGQFIGSPILGALSDDYGRKKLLAGSLFINAFCTLLTGLAIHWQLVGLLIFSRFASGLMEGNIAIARAMASDIKSIPKHTTIGRVNAAASTAYIIGPFFGGMLSDNDFYTGLTTSSPFYFISVLFVCLAVVAIYTLQDRPITSCPNKHLSIWQRLNLPKRVSVLFENQRLKFLMIVCTSFTIAVDVFYEFGPVYLTGKWLLDPSGLIMYNAVLCIGLAVGNGWLASFAASYVTKRQAITYSLMIFSFLMIGIAFTESKFVMLVLFGVIGLFISVAGTLLTVKISDSAGDAIQGEVMGTQLSLRVLGDALICLVGGVLLLVSCKFILLLSTVISGLSLLYYMRSKSAQYSTN